MLKRREISAYWREARNLASFLRLLRVRLSQSKVGPVVCRKPITVDVDLRSLGPGVRLRSHTTDVSVLGEIVVGRSYDQLAAAVEEEPRMIVDLGANTGLVARWFLERFPYARLISLEPEAGNFAVLEHNLASSGGRARALEAAVGGHARRSTLVPGGGEFGFRVDDEGSSSTPVDVITMAQVLAAVDGPVDVCKVDIEGAERELFETAGTWLPRVRLVSVECHHPFGAAHLLDLVRACGVRAEVLSLDSTPQFGCDTIVFRVMPGVAGAAPKPRRASAPVR